MNQKYIKYQNQRNLDVKKKLLFIINVDRFFISHRLPIALAAQKEGYEVHIATTLTLPIETLTRHGFIVHPLSLDRSNSNIFSIGREFFELLTTLKQIQPDIVHLVTIKPVLLGGLAARIAKVPALVAAVSGLGFLFLQTGVLASSRRFLVGILYRLALKHSNISIIFQNRDDLVLIQKYIGLKDECIELIHGSGVDLSEYQYHQPPEGIPIVILAARLLVDKGVHEFVEAARLLSKHKIARFILAGDVDYNNPASLKCSEVQTWVHQGFIEWLGHCNDMPNLLSNSHIVVLPSYREGFPKILIEAAACGRPIITTDVPGCREAVIPNKTGLLVPKGDATILADAIYNLLKNPALRKNMGEAARQFAESNFDILQVVNHHLKIYEKIYNL